MNWFKHNASNFKRTPYRNKKILEAARSEACLVNLPGCTGGGSDTQPAHSNSSDDGKGGAQKADDHCVAFACQYCHDCLDGRRKVNQFEDLKIKGAPDLYMSKGELGWYHDRGIKRTFRRLLDKGVLK